MSMPDELDALPDDVQKLLDEELASAGPPPDVAARLHAKIGASVGKGAAAAVSTGAAVKTAIVLLAAGAALTAGWLGLRESPFEKPPVLPPPAVHEVAAPVEPMQPEIPLAPARPVVPVEKPRPAPRVIHREPAPPEPTPPPPPVEEKPLPIDTLAEESVMLEQARGALTDGNAHAALRAVVMHKERFPSGTLAEERAALEVMALAGMRRVDDARAAGRAFRAAYPQSIFLPVVADAVDALEIE